MRELAVGCANLPLGAPTRRQVRKLGVRCANSPLRYGLKTNFYCGEQIPKDGARLPSDEALDESLEINEAE